MKQEPSQNANRAAKTIEASKSCKAIAKDRLISFVFPSNEDGTFTENEEDRVHLLFGTHFPWPYLRAEGDDISYDPSKMDRELEP